MLKQKFISKQELDIYIKQQEERKIRGYLTHSERDQLDRLKRNPEEFIKKEELKETKPIVTNIKKLKQPCEAVKNGENIEQLIKDLKNTLEASKGVGLSANQIGVNKRVAVCKVPKMNRKTRKVDIKEVILINPKIIERSKSYIVRGERCLSLPGMKINTDRYVFAIIEYYNLKLEPQILMAQDLEALIYQHEIDHLNGKTILDRKHKRRK